MADKSSYTETYHRSGFRDFKLHHRELSIPDKSLDERSTFSSGQIQTKVTLYKRATGPIIECKEVFENGVRISKFLKLRNMIEEENFYDDDGKYQKTLIYKRDGQVEEEIRAQNEDLDESITGDISESEVQEEEDLFEDKQLLKYLEPVNHSIVQ